MGLAATKQEEFWEACGFGHTERVRKLIADGINVNWVSYTHNSCAIHVASQGKKEIVRMLLDAGCNVNAVDDRGNLALHHAAMTGHADIISILIAAGSDIDCQEKNGWTALITAAYFCQLKAVEVLINNNCSVAIQNKDSRTALHEACRSQSDAEQDLRDIAKLLIDAGAELDSKAVDAGEADFTPLMFCAYHGHASVAQCLVDAQCDANASAKNGWTALHWAADRGHTDVIEVLLNCPAVNPHIRNKRGELASDRAKNTVVKSLIVDAMACRHGDTDAMTTEARIATMGCEISSAASQHSALVQRLTAQNSVSSDGTDTLDENDSSVNESSDRHSEKEDSEKCSSNE